MEKRFKRLINRYRQLQDELMEYNSALHDPMQYDIEGYEEDLNNDELTPERLEDLANQVIAFKHMLKAFKMINYIYS